MRDSVLDYINTYELIQKGKPVLAGVSGGVDSMVLLHVLHELGFEVHVAHVNYQLRGADSDGDEALVARFCAERAIPFHVKMGAPSLKEGEGGHSFQEAARDERYIFFATLARENSIEVVAVAHHLDDQAETLLLKLMKGSGMDGLGSMRPKRSLSVDHDVQLVRPLLGQSREAITKYALQHNIPWREDMSNASNAYQRNVIRNQVMPLLKSHFGEAVPANLARSAAMLQGYWDHGLKNELERRFRRCSPESDRLDIAELTAQPKTWQYRLALEALYTWMPWQPVGLPQAEALLGLLEAQVGRKMMLPTGIVWREREHLVYKKEQSEEARDARSWSPDIEKGDTLVFDGGILDISLHIEKPTSLTVADSNVILADREAIGSSLVIRLWKPGDRMVPFGMTGHKKVSDILTDAKIPSHQRALTYVLEAAREVIWVLGVRMADSIKVTSETKEIVEVSYHPVG